MAPECKYGPRNYLSCKYVLFEILNTSHRVFRLSEFDFAIWQKIAELLAFFVVALGTLTFLVLFFCYKKSKEGNHCMDLPCIGAPRVEPGFRSGHFRRQQGWNQSKT